jgi:hypothetical protein
MFTGRAGFGFSQAIAALDAQSIAYTGVLPNRVIFGINRVGPGFISATFGPIRLPTAAPSPLKISIQDCLGFA